MPIPQKTTGAGTKAFFSVDDKDYKLFASVSKIAPPSMSRGTVDVTDMNSYEDNDQFKESLASFIEADEMTIEGFYVKEDAARDALEEAFYTGNPVYIKIQLPPAIGKDMTVYGLLTKYQSFGEITPESGIAFSTSLKPNKKPTLTDTKVEANNENS